MSKYDDYTEEDWQKMTDEDWEQYWKDWDA